MEEGGGGGAQRLHRWGGGCSCGINPANCTDRCVAMAGLGFDAKHDRFYKDGGEAFGDGAFHRHMALSIYNPADGSVRSRSGFPNLQLMKCTS